MAILLIAVLWFTVFAPDPVMVKVVAIERGTVESTVTNSKAGTLRSRMRSHMSAETGGRVTHIYFREGSSVKRGDLLIKLNDTSSQARIELSQAAIATSIEQRKEACLNRDYAKRDVDRTRELARNNVTSVEALDRLEVAYQSAEAGCNGARAQVDRSRAELRVAQAEFDKTEIHAPFDGIVAEVNAEVGEWVTPSPPMLSAPSVIDILDPSSIYVSAPMDEVDSNRIRVGQPAKITIDSHPGESFAGHVVRVAPYILDIETQNRTIEVEVEFDLLPSPDTILVGTSADIEVTLDTRHETLRIPAQTLLQGERVLLLVDGLLEERSVEVGLRNWNFVEIRAGLALGDQVVMSLDDKDVKAGAKARAEISVSTKSSKNSNIKNSADHGIAAESSLPPSAPADVGAAR
ncbi:MAG: efflux RND transporter periplasmic adaptor subunit [Myxococcales bacterium]|nr:efflux RND transporter periplasmic adaptor subunit [Myxococcales bacterium]